MFDSAVWSLLVLAATTGADQSPAVLAADAHAKAIVAMADQTTAETGANVTGANPACVPVPREPAWWMVWHKRYLKAVEKRPIDVVFLGDSITMLWHPVGKYANGLAVWKEYYEPLKAVNIAITGDTTANVLWRIVEGKAVDGLSPKVLVLMIGTNNLHSRQGNTPAQTAEGVGCIVSELRKRLPQTKILLLGVFPRGESPKNPYREKVREVNRRIATFDDHKWVFYLDIGDRFLEPDGTISKAVLRDFLHPSEKGYAIWAKAMHPYLLDLLNNDGQGDVWRPAKPDAK